MDYFDPEVISHWLLHYGSFSLFVLLVLGIIVLPIPEETLMVIAGVLMSQEKLAIHSTLFAVYLGSMCGITGSYLIGRTAGLYLIHKYGQWFGITDQKLQKIHDWFKHYGKWTLVVGYFIPGVRHFTGIIAGTSSLEFSHFAVFAYTGAILWVSTFLSIGYFFGGYWSELFENIEVSADWVVIILGLFLALYLVYKIKKQQR